MQSVCLTWHMQLDNADASLAQNVTIQYRAFLDANMWMGFGYSMDSASQVGHSPTIHLFSRVPPTLHIYYLGF